MPIVTVLLICLALVGCSQQPAPQQAVAQFGPAIPATAQKVVNWTVSSSVDKMDGLPEITLMDSSNDGGTLVIRCQHGRTDAYVHLDNVVDHPAVRVRFDQEKPAHQEWNEGGNYNDALFAPDAIAFTTRLAASHSFVIEYHPFRRTATAIQFNVEGLEGQLAPVISACHWARIEKDRAAHAAEEKAALRVSVMEHVHPCAGEHAGQWCWSDPDLPSYSGGLQVVDEHAFVTKEKAVEDAIRAKKEGRAFWRD